MSLSSEDEASITRNGIKNLFGYVLHLLEGEAASSKHPFLEAYAKTLEDKTRMPISMNHGVEK